MTFIRFILGKIVIVEVMTLILFMAMNLFGISIEPLNMILATILKYLTPIAAICLIPYLILSIFSSKFLDIVTAIVVGGLILYYLIVYVKLF
ncbi:MAG: hypothetical protein VZS44_02280 [Bacilli bacterium]|nr:hypothetical protein [Bacilli bacterium]